MMLHEMMSSLSVGCLSYLLSLFVSVVLLLQVIMTMMMFADDDQLMDILSILRVLILLPDDLR